MQLSNQKTSFLIAVYSTLLVQLLITFAIVYKFHGNAPINAISQKYWLLFVILTFAIILMLAFVRMHPMLKLLLFSLFAVSFGFMILTVSANYPTERVHIALISALAVFVMTSIVGLILTNLGYNTRFMLPYLLVALLAIIITEIILFINKSNGKTFHIVLVLVIVLFAIFNMVDTNMVLSKDYFGDYITASIDFYLNILNTFMAIFGLEG